MQIKREHWDDGNLENYKPETMNMMQQSALKMKSQTEIQPAASTIPQDMRNNVRIVELPSCKMVTSGPAKSEDAFAPGGKMERFDKWATEYDKQRTDRFYPRDFMWSPVSGGFEWGSAVDEVPDDIGGFDVIDFPGGLYAVAISVDADGADHDRVYNEILKWVNNSGCFVLDENGTRRSMGNITSPHLIKEVMGYQQMDLYFPIRIKEA